MLRAIMRAEQGYHLVNYRLLLALCAVRLHRHLNGARTIFQRAVKHVTGLPQNRIAAYLSAVLSAPEQAVKYPVIMAQMVTRHTDVAVDTPQRKGQVDEISIFDHRVQMIFGQRL